MSQRQQFPVVGIGASAGGVEALQALFRALDAKQGLAFVVVTHLGPARESELPAILARCTTMPVEPAQDGQEVQHGHAYVLPNDSRLTIAEGRLHLHPQDPLAVRERQPIDLFFASLAQDQGECAVGIVLSGGGSDGALGIKAIREQGGLTLAQGANGSAPRNPSMPASAIATGDVDLVLPLEEIPARLVEFSRGLLALDGLTGEDRRQAEVEQLATTRAEICEVLRGRVGHDFSGYKEKTFLRRVRRRMQVVRLANLEAYVARLRHNPEEVVALFRDLLINVTGFFRDTAAFEALALNVLPLLLAGRRADDTVRVWVPGCSTGEEAYSLAILLREQMERLPNPPRVQVFATDIDDAALAVARTGRYPALLLKDISPERLRRFFSGDGTAYAVTKEVRDLCVFSLHNLIRDPPFSRIDLISCRNLLIYLDSDVQDRVVPTFHYALRPGGFLFLGASENVTRRSDLFAPIDKSNSIFRRRDHAHNDMSFQPVVSTPGDSPWLGTRPLRQPRATAEQELRQGVEALVLEQFAPAHVVVDREGEVLLQSTRLGKYLEPAAGLPSRQLLAMARRGLRLDLRAALREAMETRRRIIRPRVEVEVDDRTQALELTVTPLPGRNEAEPLFLVLFADLGAPVPTGEALLRATGDAALTIADLEQELRETRERLQSTVEELRSANEEMVSVNEELQSVNEELETSKEEQQSVNEELQTVNQALATKVEELDQANADIRNLFESTRIAIVFLDRNLLIRSYTPAVAGIFNLIPADRGRPLTDFASNLDNIDLRAEVEAVMAQHEPIERRVTSHKGARHYMMRLLPYRTVGASMEGVLVTLVDVSQMVETEIQLRTLVDELNHRVRNTLQVVSAVATQTLRASPAPGDFARSFIGRLQALGRAHDLVSKGRWGDVPLHDLVAKELDPYKVSPGRILVEGQPQLLSAKIALALGMALHELATNAAKYGALSTELGRVAVTWEVLGRKPDQRLVLNWREEGGPRVTPPSRRGFGSDLIERQLRHDLRGHIEVEFAAEGLRAALTIPLNQAPEAANGGEAAAVTTG